MVQDRVFTVGGRMKCQFTAASSLPALFSKELNWLMVGEFKLMLAMAVRISFLVLLRSRFVTKVFLRRVSSIFASFPVIITVHLIS